AAVLRLPLLVVARRSLGTLNHTLMTLEIARHRGLPVVGVVVSETEPAAGLAALAAVDEMRKRGVPVLAVVPHGGTPIPEPDWWSLAGG
ncbi:MAG: AAA family ATPase, partial [Gemmataceae bacterium]|nr:AAA family ATPase [Gemmataceae bacterium]